MFLGRPGCRHNRIATGSRSDHTCHTSASTRAATIPLHTPPCHSPPDIHHSQPSTGSPSIFPTQTAPGPTNGCRPCATSDCVRRVAAVVGLQPPTAIQRTSCANFNHRTPSCLSASKSNVDLHIAAVTPGIHGETDAAAALGLFFSAAILIQHFRVSREYALCGLWKYTMEFGPQIVLNIQSRTHGPFPFSSQIGQYSPHKSNVWPGVCVSILKMCGGLDEWKADLQRRLTDVKDIDVSFSEFPYYLGPPRNSFIDSSYTRLNIHSKSEKLTKNFAVWSRRRPTVFDKSVDNELVIDMLFEIVSLESERGFMILFVKDIEKLVNVIPNYKMKLEALPINVVVIASHTQLITQKDTVLSRIDFVCPHLEIISIKDQTVSGENAEKAIGWALTHHFIHCKDDRNVISCESINYGVQILQGDQDENKSLKESPVDVVTDNKYEKERLAEVIPPGDVGVSFNDIGALENVKETLKELVMLPLQRPEVFSKRQLIKTCKGILIFGPHGTGKTMLAKAVARESGANFINLVSSIITSELLGETKNRVKAAFTLARKLAPCVIFIDDVDGMLV
ncbi:hypothetical protein OROMI_011830 [Orobanche minor]